MRASRPLVLLALVLAGSLPAIGFACNSSSGALNGGPPGETSADGAAITDGGGSAEDSALGATDAPRSFVVDSGTPDTTLPFNTVDAADIPEGGARVAYPGVVSCGVQGTCNAFAGVQCCLGDEGGACLSTGVSCPPDSVSITCDEFTDCVVGKLCCGNATPLDSGAVGIAAACAATCAASMPQLCRTNAECPDGKPCTLQMCSDGNQYEFCEVYSSPPDAAFSFTCTADY